MASGTYWIGTNNQYIDGYVEWIESNSSVSNNTSTVTMNVYLHRTNTYSGTPTSLNNINLTRTFYINGTHSWTEAVTMTIPNNKSYVLVASWTEQNIPHNSDGTLSLSIGFEMSNARGNSGFTVPRQNSTATLDTIPRASKLDSVSINVPNGTISWYFTRYSNIFTDNLSVIGGDYSFVIENVATSGNQNLTSAQLNKLYAMIGTGTSATVNCYLGTYNSGVLVGYSNTFSTTITLPSYNLQWSNVSCVDNINTFDTYKVNSDDLIARLSNPKFTFLAASSTGDTYGRQIGYTLNDVGVTSPHIVTNYTGETYTLKASDGRKEVLWSPSNTIINYSYPTLQCVVRRTSPTASTANVTITGTYYDGTGLTNLNNLYIDFAYTETGGSQQTVTSFNITSTTSNNIVSFTATTTITGLDYTKGITYTSSMKDLLLVSPTSANGTIPRGQPAWNSYYDNNGKSNFNVYGFYKRDEDCFFPIGYIYMSVESTDPSTYFGGTWTRIKDVFLLSAGDTYTAGSTGGAATVTLTEAQMPKHNHSPYVSSATYSGANFYIRHGNTAGTDIVAAGTYTSVDEGVGATWSNGIYTSTYSHAIDRVNIGGTISVSVAEYDKGNGQAHENMPPYLTVFVWQRTG